MKGNFSKIKLFLFDMDGTIYLGNTLFDFTVELLGEIRKHNKKYLFITNNSSKSVNAYIEKLGKMGISASKEDFVTSSMATVGYLNSNYPGSTLYVCGTESLKSELRDAGYTITENTEKTDCIVLGFDTELTFKKLDDISRMLCTRDIPYIATNPDYVCPTEYGSVPDCGSVTDMLFNATGKRPYVIGKPKPLMIELAMEKEGVTPEETAVIGDRIYTDIMSGVNAGTQTVLVMSGETTPEILKKSDVRPTYVFESVKTILERLRNEYDI